MPESTLIRSVDTRVRAGLEGFQTHERIALLYFMYLASLSLFRPVEPLQRFVLFAVPVVVFALIHCEIRASRPWSRVLRQWGSLALILIAYWLLAWLAGPRLDKAESLWAQWDQRVLSSDGLDRIIEAAGWVGPSLIEACYLLVYVIPPVSLGILYACGAVAHSNRFLSILFLGTLSVYVVLSLFSVHSPRLAFPQDLEPHFHGVSHQINVFLLDHYDITTSVFPSGHVAVAFSSALGLFSTIRERSWIWSAAFLITLLVYLNTIYARYHYAVDGLTSLCLVLLTWVVSRRWKPESD